MFNILYIQSSFYFLNFIKLILYLYTFFGPNTPWSFIVYFSPQCEQGNTYFSLKMDHEFCSLENVL